ncbi:putative Reverse transcriptase (RNA-dependent DNA polymerase) [Paratrimastix pyriformis]|uniref:Reverse transcriptase (RNA-dependent DNA polymerase) n=1 Tax=Paratrimastix pyriformis TaxID=342808 RepID=A0ABQ8UEL5_9EUKA|nr:putative Reverse transcriptase (RNA-dependent DNA polymerase) [Paratrimastix pyriformis]
MSAPGPDLFPYWAWKVTPDLSAQLLFDLFSFISTPGNRLPPAMLEACLHVFSKKPPSTSILDLRPISIPNTAVRILSSAVKTALLPFAEVLHPAQHGFIPERDIGDPIREVADRIYSHHRSSQPLISLFIDMRKAYDSVNRFSLITILHHFHIPDPILFAVSNLLQPTFCTTALQPPTRVPVERGVPQGSPLSPLLFVFMYDILISNLSHLSPAAFADDLYLASPTPGPLDDAYRSFTTFEAATGLALNRAKCVVLPVGNPPPFDTSSPWATVPVENSFRYLGILIGPSLSFPALLKTPTERIIERIGQLKALKLTFSQRLRAANTFLSPILSYLFRFIWFPPDSLHPIARLISEYVSPIPNALPPELISLPTSRGGMAPPLRHLPSLNLATLLSIPPTPPPLTQPQHPSFDLQDLLAEPPQPRPTPTP